MVTIKDVARDAGVSVGTVSNVLNGGRVSEARRKLVEASIEKLGYQVNTLAKGMRMQKTDYVVAESDQSVFCTVAGCSGKRIVSSRKTGTAMPVR